MITNAACSIVHGDCREVLKNYVNQADVIITSPPYADARDKHYDSVRPDQFVDWFLTFHEPIFNALKPEGSLIINIKDKVVNGVRHRYVWQTINALCERGWFAIDDYIWHKKNAMPGRWPNRLRDGWEYCFHLSKSKRPYFNARAVEQPIGAWASDRLTRLRANDTINYQSATQSGFERNLSRWVGKQTILPSNVLMYAAANRNYGHPAAFPVDLPLFFIKLLCPEGGLVVDPFAGSGTTGVAAQTLGRRCLLIDNHAPYCQVAQQRMSGTLPPIKGTSQVVTPAGAQTRETHLASDLIPCC